uniref:Uncharacterized protein n=1 Tax=Anguilla anguilla TaxID=7936 RepID=A0A0E9SUF0_ANGAN
MKGYLITSFSYNSHKLCSFFINFLKFS